MKNKRTSFTAMILFLFTLSACSISNTETLMQDVYEAIQNNQTLENATYETSLTTQPEDINQRAEGAFVSLENDEYNWTHTEFMGSENNFTQIIEIDGRQFQFISIEDPNFEPEWQEVEADTHQLSNQISPLFENTIEEEYIDEVEVSEENGQHYLVTLTDAYTESFTSETIQELEQTVADLEEAGDDTGYIEVLEEQIERIKAMEYSDPELELHIDEADYLVHYLSRYTFTVPDSDPVTVTLQFELTDYNLADASNLVPDIDEIASE